MTSKNARKKARRTGRKVLWAVRLTTAGTFAALVLYLVVAALLDDPPAAPAWLFVLPVLVPAAAAVLFWRPAYRVPECMWLTAASGFLLGVLGLGWGSRAAGVLGALVVLVVLVSPRDGGAKRNAGSQIDDLDAGARTP